MAHLIKLIHEVEFTDGELYPVRFITEVEKDDENVFQITGQTQWNSEFYTIEQNEIIRKESLSNEFKEKVYDAANDSFFMNDF